MELVVALTFFGCNGLNAIPLTCVSMIDRKK